MTDIKFLFASKYFIYVCHLAQINLSELNHSCTVDVAFPQLVTGHYRHITRIKKPNTVWDIFGLGLQFSLAVFIIKNTKYS